MKLVWVPDEYVGDHASEVTIAVADAGSTQSNGPRRQDLRDIVADGVLASGSIAPLRYSNLTCSPPTRAALASEPSEEQF